jgi:glutamate-5-semialdehyde dehydrogenase
MDSTTLEILSKARLAAPALSTLNEDVINYALWRMSEDLKARCGEVLAANAIDLATYGAQLGDVMSDRLRLNESRVFAMAKGLHDVGALPSPLGKVLSEYRREDGLIIKKVSVPFGVIGIIYESRPNVTSDAAALCFKSGNVCALRCGKEAYNSAKAIVDILKDSLVKCGLNPDFINILPPTRDAADTLMRARGLVDLLIPRGGAGLIKAVTENSTVPCIETGTGICHIFVDGSADLNTALSIIDNAKTSRPSVCNAAEVCLVDSAVASKFLPMLRAKLVDERIKDDKQAVKLIIDARASEIIDGEKAGDKDFDTEFLDYVLAVKIVDGVGEAIDHIARHSTHHSDCIITQSADNAKKFIAGVDSAAVYVNASTRFTDGGEFGKGCEIGISTQKLHARGPMGLEEMTTYKYVILGSGQVRK